MRDQQQQRTANHADSLPTFFPSFDSFQHRQVVRIRKNVSRHFKTDVMLPQVVLIFILIPFKINIHFCNYNLIVI
ncbi:Uncharacterised protein [Serratia ficaria]|uniref:Uncharacterized protein n=1 Tax=Serratia ficaria TaxID=61651 RepID=A0A240CCR5_SERFI|nr:hypothetical protein C7332_1477 [Serratia ficaria]CAI0707051.1 Uncharacterised protein [Serratia ficaria]CAI1056681.1 Uncharacterised protein [Serratia ficaria]CAI1093083.1 Uncharacterised protein [Serratia ficaria]CAI1111926.1 Uncharacterised protein [Serratia ficaria]